MNAMQSLPARGAWIEITCASHSKRQKKVAPRKGGVD